MSKGQAKKGHMVPTLKCSHCLTEKVERHLAHRKSYSGSYHFFLCIPDCNPVQYTLIGYILVEDEYILIPYELRYKRRLVCDEIRGSLLNEWRASKERTYTSRV